MKSLIPLLVVLSALTYRPGQEYKTVTTDQYEISVQKNGRTDVNLVSRAPVFSNAYPMIWLEGEEAPRPMAIDGRWSERQGVNDPLGEGNGIRFMRKDTEWILRTYPPAQPFLVAQVAFTNTGKKPVKVRMLSPWAVGGAKPGQLSLGAGTKDAAVLTNGTLTQSEVKLQNASSGEAVSMWNLAVANRATGRSLIAGFLTNGKGLTQIRMNRTDKAKDDAIDLFRAECVYDPPVEVAPGGRLESEVLYLSVADMEPLEGLERYGLNMSKFMGRKPDRGYVPHGWDSWNTKLHTDINEANMLAALDYVDHNLKRYGWKHFAIDAGWEIAKGNWEPNPERFPHGLRWLTDEIHRRGMTAGIWIDPFTVNLETPLAKEHPDWLVKAGGIGKTLVDDNERLLDVTKPEVYAHVVALFKKIGDTWGFDALMEADFVYRLYFAEGYAQPQLTHVEVFRLGMQAIREGFGDRFIMSMPPMPANSSYADGMRIGNDCGPIWEKVEGKWAWGCVDTLSNAAHRYFLAPHVWRIDQDCAYFGHPGTKKRWGVESQPDLTLNQSLAWLTGAAMTGGVVKIGDYFGDLTPEQTAILTRLLPSTPFPARPVDLFERQDPCIWSLPVDSAIGRWHVVAVFNWDAKAAQKIPLSFAQLGLSPEKPYAVYDFWQDTYFGAAQGGLNVDTAPGSVHLLCLRPYEEHPFFLATDRHITMGATDFTALEWQPQTRRLTGTFDGVENTVYKLRVIAPEGYAAKNATSSAGAVQWRQEKQLVKLELTATAAGPVTWAVEF